MLSTHVDTLRETITDEIFIALGAARDGWLRRRLGILFRPPAQRFARLAADWEQRIADGSLHTAARWLLPRFVEDSQVFGQEFVPTAGPLLVVSNHPGVIDGLVILANLVREDVKLVLSGVPFTQALAATREHLIYTPREIHARMEVVRSSIRQLRAGGAVLLFPAGRLEPDPAILPGAEASLGSWSASVALLLRKVPETKLLVTIASGVLAAESMRHPLVRLRRRAYDRQKLAEFVQVMRQMFTAHRFGLRPRLSFAPPVGIDDLTAGIPETGLMEAIIVLARRQLDAHRSREMS